MAFTVPRPAAEFGEWKLKREQTAKRKTIWSVKTWQRKNFQDFTHFALNSSGCMKHRNYSCLSGEKLLFWNGQLDRKWSATWSRLGRPAPRSRWRGRSRTVPCSTSRRWRSADPGRDADLQPIRQQIQTLNTFYNKKQNLSPGHDDEANKGSLLLFLVPLDQLALELILL